MCPDKETLSAYFDGEVDKEFSQKLKKHIESCPDCKKVLDSFNNLKYLFGDENIDLEASQKRVKERIDFDLSRKFIRPSFWKKDISLPIPLAAAAAIMILFMGYFFLNNSSSNNTIPMASFQNTEDIFDIQADSLEEVVKFFNSNDIPIEVNININESPDLNAVSWEPELIKAVDYKRHYK